MRWRPVLRTLLVLLVLAGLGAGAWTQRHRWQKSDAPEPAAGGGSGPADIQSVKLSDETVRGLDLQSRGSAARRLSHRDRGAGSYHRRGGRARAVSFPVAGVVAKVHVTPGEAVRPGDPLFTVQLSSEFLQAGQTDLARSAKDLVAATAQRDQTAKLVAAGTKRGQELIDDENQVRRLTTQVEGHRRQLLLFGLDTAQVKRVEAGDYVTEIVVAVPPANPPARTVPVGAGTPPFRATRLCSRSRSSRSRSPRARASPPVNSWRGWPTTANS